MMDVREVKLHTIEPDEHMRTMRLDMNGLREHDINIHQWVAEHYTNVYVKEIE